MICPDQDPTDVFANGIVRPGPTPTITIHITCTVIASTKTEYTFTAVPNPYNGFDRTSTFPVTISLNNPRWSEENKRMFTPTKGTMVKITGILSSVHADPDRVNHWVVVTSEIYFLKDSLSATKPAVPGTGKISLPISGSNCPNLTALVRTDKPGKAFSYSNMSPSPLKRQRSD